MEGEQKRMTRSLWNWLTPKAVPRPGQDGTPPPPGYLGNTGSAQSTERPCETGSSDHLTGVGLEDRGNIPNDIFSLMAVDQDTAEEINRARENTSEVLFCTRNPSPPTHWSKSCSWCDAMPQSNSLSKHLFLFSFWLSCRRLVPWPSVLSHFHLSPFKRTGGPLPSTYLSTVWTNRQTKSAAGAIWSPWC